MDRFWRKVDKAGDCWVWTGNRDKNGYGLIKIDGRNRRAHRVSYVLVISDPGSLSVLHMCDNPPCGRPDHLFLGTAKDNVRDMASKGRHRNSAKTHCPAGHEYNDTNTCFPSRGGRVCRICVRDRMRIRRQQSKR